MSRKAHSTYRELRENRLTLLVSQSDRGHSGHGDRRGIGHRSALPGAGRRWKGASSVCVDELRAHPKLSLNDGAIRADAVERIDAASSH